MKIVREDIPVMTIEHFAQEHDLTMLITENRVQTYSPSRYRARFKHCEIMENGVLITSSGSGNTFREAINNYADLIQLKRIAINAYQHDRREIDVPRLVPFT